MAIKGRKPTYSAPSTLRSAIDAYFELCETSGEFPDYAGMKLALQLTDEKIKKMQHESNKEHDKYIEIFNYAKDRRESWLCRRMAANGKQSQGYMNLLKQPINGGYVDKPVDSGEKTLNVKIMDAGGWNAFK